MDKLRKAWALAHGARRSRDPERIRLAYGRLLVAAGFVVLDEERAGRDPLARLLVASGAVE